MDTNRACRDTHGDLLIHATNAWNPTGLNLRQVAGTRLYYVHAEGLHGERTYVLLGTQQHLTFVADLPDHVPPDALRSHPSPSPRTA